MDDGYESITAAATGAIEAMAREPRDNAICGVESVRSLAAYVYWSWAHLVGQSARPQDSDRMEQLIGSMAPPATPAL